MSGTARYSQSFEVADLVRAGWTIGAALIEILGQIKDGSRPPTSAVADDAIKLLGERP
jgi:hypothetical protein